MAFGEIKAANTSEPAMAACRTHRIGGGQAAFLSRRKFASRSVPPGRAGRMYPGSFDCEIEKKTMISAVQSSRNTFRESVVCLRKPRNAHHGAAATNSDHGTHARKLTGRQ